MLRDDDRDQAGAEERGPAMSASGRCATSGSRVEVVGLVDAEQHDHEQEQDDDGAGVDDHLHGGEEVGVLGDEQHATPKSVADQAQRGVHRVARAATTPSAPASTMTAATAKTAASISAHPRAGPRRGSALAGRRRRSSGVWPVSGAFDAEAELARPGDLPS